ncbi:hypothetical protein vBSflM004_114 [Shigella phage vB_SflM_004]|nr:hypothetical protein vBSflM004_114 [Shigella phage vB_SflM_004]
MSKVQVIFPICDFSLEPEFDLYEELTDDVIWGVVSKAIKKLYGGLLNPNNAKVSTKQVSEPYTSYDAEKRKFEITCYDLLVSENKINYFFVREYADA